MLLPWVPGAHMRLRPSSLLSRPSLYFQTSPFSHLSPALLLPLFPQSIRLPRIHINPISLVSVHAALGGFVPGLVSVYTREDSLAGSANRQYCSSSLYHLAYHLINCSHLHTLALLFHIIFRQCHHQRNHHQGSHLPNFSLRHVPLHNHP